MIGILTSVIGLSVSALIIWLVRKDRLHVNHALGWMVVAAAFALLGLAPSLMDDLASLVGVAYPPALALTLAITVLVVKTLSMDIERSRLQVSIERLTQRLAMLEADLESHSKTAGESSADEQDENHGSSPD